MLVFTRGYERVKAKLTFVSFSLFNLSLRWKSIRCLLTNCKLSDDPSPPPFLDPFLPRCGLLLDQSCSMTWSWDSDCQQRCWMRRCNARRCCTTRKTGICARVCCAMRNVRFNRKGCRFFRLSKMSVPFLLISLAARPFA